MVGSVCVRASLRAMSVALVLAGIGVFPASDATAQAGQGLGRSGRWFTYDGQPVYLVGFDCQELGSDPTIDYVRALDLFAQYRINVARIFVYTWFLDSSLTPWTRDGSGRHNLDQWNPAYWTRLKDFLAKARDRKIMVEVELFGIYPERPSYWSGKAYNRTNNVNGAFSANASGHFYPEYYDLNYAETSTSGKRVRDYHQALLDKVLAEFGGFENIFIEVCNEFGSGADVDTWYPWQLYWAQRIDGASARLVALNATEGWTFRPEFYWDKAYVDVLNNRLATGSAQDISNQLHAAQLKGKILRLNETTGDYQGQANLDTQTGYAWGMFLSGGHTAIYEDDSSRIGSDAWVQMAQRLKALRDVVEKVRFWELSPVDAGGNEYDGLIRQGPSGGNRQLLCKPGSEYVAYFWGSQDTTAVRIDLPAGDYTYEWYDARDASLEGTGTVPGGGTATIPSPPTSSWSVAAGLALVIRTSTPGSLPAAPSSLAATAISSSQINLAWTDNSTNETGFKIERKTGVGGTWSQIATVGANVTSYQNTGLAASTTYYYRVRATNAAGDSAYSNEANATTQAPPEVRG